MDMRVDVLTVILFVRDLYPLGHGSKPENPEIVAKAIGIQVKTRGLGSSLPPEIEELTKIACEWQGDAPTQGLLDRMRGRPAPAHRGEMEFLDAAAVIVERWNLLDGNGYFRNDWQAHVREHSRYH